MKPHVEIPLISVCIIAYNHENFISQTLDGVLNQHTTFPLEVLVADDHSPDGTKQVIEEYADRFSGRLSVIERPRNLGMMLNLLDVLSKCRGKYIAICEGDDFWIDNRKLQIQVDFLESNPDYAICFHQVQVVNEFGIALSEKLHANNQAIISDIQDLAKGNFLSTLSCVFRNTFQDKETGQMRMPFWLSEVSIGDYCLHMLNARYGKVKYFPQTMGAYRMHQAGAWSLQNQTSRSIKLFDTLQLLKKEFTGTVRQLLDEQQLHNLSVVADENRNQKDFDLGAFLQSRREAILELISAQYVPFMQNFFHQKQASISMEYRLGNRLFKPLRWAVDSIRRLKK